jgi:hypothetical protein
VPAIVILLVGIFLLWLAQDFTTHHRPARRLEVESASKKPSSDAPPQPAKQQDEQTRIGNIYEGDFLRHDLIWAVLSAIAVTIFFSSRTFAAVLGPNCTLPAAIHLLGFDVNAKYPFLAATTVCAVPVYGIGWIFGSPQEFSCRDWICWAASGLVYGFLVGVGAYLYCLLDPYSTACIPTPLVSHLLVPVIFGVPWVLLSQLIADNVSVGLVSYEPYSDSDREWLGRAAGWLAAVAIGWMLLAFLVFAGSYFVQETGAWLGKTGLCRSTDYWAFNRSG